MSLHAGRIAGTIRLAFGGAVDASRVEHLAGDASVRSFHRVWLGGGGGAGEGAVPATAVLMHDPRPAADDGCGDDFVAIERHLRHHGVGVPRVYARDRDAGLYLLEDLGDRVLQDEVKDAPPARRRALYRAALEVLVVLARDASRLDPAPTPAHARAFDEAKLGWEMEFFLTHTVTGLWRVKLGESDLAALRAGFAALVGALAKLPRVFTHRDYHSRNLLVQGDATMRVVDFQDARMGPAVYDLASLLRDSYLDLDEDENAALLEEHRLRLLEAGVDVPGREAFVADYDRMSVQRGLKALGTFGYMATHRGKTGYLEAVPRTLARVEAALGRLSDTRDLARTLLPILRDEPLESEGRRGMRRARLGLRAARPAFEWFEKIRATQRQTARIAAEPGEGERSPATQLGGAPWWPRGRPRPTCGGAGHAMAFYFQVRLSDVPGLETDGATLLSFHHCDVCASAGTARHGRSRSADRCWSVDLLEVGPPSACDELTVVAASAITPVRISLARLAEAPLLVDMPEDLAARIPAAWWPHGDLVDELGFGFAHVQSAKLGGWPSWVQDAGWIECADCGRMQFVAQLDWKLCGAGVPWGGGGYGYLFVCSPRCSDRRGELVIQTT